MSKASQTVAAFKQLQRDYITHCNREQQPSHPEFKIHTWQSLGACIILRKH